MGKRNEDGCFICGTCWWHLCENDADYVVRDVFVKRQGIPVYQGDVDLCAGHSSYLQRTNHLNLQWEALEQALARQQGRV